MAYTSCIFDEAGPAGSGVVDRGRGARPTKPLLIAFCLGLLLPMPALGQSAMVDCADLPNTLRLSLAACASFQASEEAAQIAAQGGAGVGAAADGSGDFGDASLLGSFGDGVSGVDGGLSGLDGAASGASAALSSFGSSGGPLVDVDGGATGGGSGGLITADPSLRVGGSDPFATGSVGAGAIDDDDLLDSNAAADAGRGGSALSINNLTTSTANELLSSRTDANSGNFGSDATVRSDRQSETGRANANSGGESRTSVGTGGLGGLLD